jgi:hypothetical protein
MRMQQSIQTCEIISIHVFIGCMCNNRYTYIRMQLNMYAIIQMNVDAIREREKPRFLSLFGYYKKGFSS